MVSYASSMIPYIFCIFVNLIVDIIHDIMYNNDTRKSNSYERGIFMKVTSYVRINVSLHLDRLHGRNPNFAVR